MAGQNQISLGSIVEDKKHRTNDKAARPAWTQPAGDWLDRLPSLQSPPFVWPEVEIPPPFPLGDGGRLPASIEAIRHNRLSNLLLVSQGGSTCRKKIKISLFFDGTNNNEEADKVVSGAQPPSAEELARTPQQGVQAGKIQGLTYPRTTNVARLYHACIGAGGNPGQENNDPRLIGKGWFSYYIQGVGTRFKEIGDLDPGMLGEAFGLYGEERINWALTRVCASLGMSQCFKTKDGYRQRELPLPEAQAMIKNMHSAAGRRLELNKFFDMVTPDWPEQPEPERIILYIASFSRGSAEARTFVNWLCDYLLSREENTSLRLWLEHADELDKARQQAEAAKDDAAAAQQAHEQAAALLKRAGYTEPDQLRGKLEQLQYLLQHGAVHADEAHSAEEQLQRDQAGLTLLGVPIQVQMMGMFETVAAVGISPVLSMMTGHCGWAHNTMSLERPARAGFIAHAYHFVGAHEQRKSFCLDSICINGGYPPNFHEVIYPGVHSDVGGGYVPGEQFRANYGMGHVLSQIALHDMYAHFYELGMPLQVAPDRPELLEEMQQYPRFKLNDYEQMSDVTAREFDVRPELVQRFNHWRDTLASGSISQVINSQVHQYTAWRILRWVKRDISGYAQFLGIWPNPDDPAYKEAARQKAARARIMQHERVRANDAYAGKNKTAYPGWERPNMELPDEVWQEAGWQAQKGNAGFINGLLNKNYSGSNDGWDMLEGAREFINHYLHRFHFESISVGMVLNTVLGGSIAMTNNDDEVKEFEAIHKNGTQQYFHGWQASPIQAEGAAVAGNESPALSGYGLATALGQTALQSRPESERSGTMLSWAVVAQFWKRLQQADHAKMEALLHDIKTREEQLTADPVLTALYDEQLHDSRSWFMHDSPMQSREPLTNYFAYRIVYSGQYSNKPLSAVMLAGRIVGLAGVAHSAYLSVRYRNPAYLLLGLNNPELFVGEEAMLALQTLRTAERVLINPLTGQELATADNASQLWAFNKHMGAVLAAMQRDERQFKQAALAQTGQPADEALKNLSEILPVLKQQKAQAQQSGHTEQLTIISSLLQTASTNEKLLREVVTTARDSDQPMPDVDTLLYGVTGQPLAEVQALKELLPVAESRPAITARVAQYEQGRNVANHAAIPPQAGLEQALNGAQVQMATDTLQALGIEAEVNEYLPGRLIQGERSGIIRLAQQLASGETVPELGVLSPGQRQMMLKMLQYWLDSAESV